MIQPAFFILWGTKTRRRLRGVRGEFCPGCLRLTRFNIELVEQAKHFYFVPGAYYEVARYGECALCGSRRSLSTGASVDDEADATCLDELLAENFELTRAQLTEMADRLDQQFTPSKRRQRLWTSFCTNGFRDLAIVKHDTAGWVGLIFVVCAVAAGFIFAYGGAVAGALVSAAIFIAVLACRHQLIHWSLANRLISRLSAIFEIPGYEWSQLDSLLASEWSESTLRRHFETRFYERFRKGFSRDGAGGSNSSMGIREYLSHEPNAFPDADVSRGEESDEATGFKCTSHNRFVIVECLHCHMRVVPKRNGSCPSCQAMISRRQQVE